MAVLYIWSTLIWQIWHYCNGEIEFTIGRVPTLLGSWTEQKYEKEAEINTPSCFHRQVFFSLLYNHLSALAPYTTAKPQACSSARSQAWLLLFPSPCTSILLFWSPSQPLPPFFSNLFFFQIRFSAQFTVQPRQHFYTENRAMQRQQEMAGNVPASPVSALPTHTAAPSASVTSSYAAA